jgi:NAD(P) transhydrogenase subunit alpha
LVTENGVTVVGAGDLPSTMPAAASAMYARNVSSLLLYLVKEGSLAIDLSDDLQRGVVITYEGRVVHPALSEPAGGTARVDGASD